MTHLQSLETPRLLLDRERLERNAERMRERCKALGVTLRPHLKTPKSLHVARVAGGGTLPPATVSTLNEAEYFARGGIADVLYAVGFTANKTSRLLRIQRETGQRVTILTDDAATLRSVAEIAARQEETVSVCIEIDCGEHRGGLPAGDPLVVQLAEIAARAPSLHFRGVMTHAGHSYASPDPRVISRIAGEERDAAVAAADAIRDAGIAVDMISVGSSPTIQYADHLVGVTEARCGIYLFWDLSQLSRAVCSIDDIAVSVLSSVIGHNRREGYLLIDAGALAMSKDIGAHKFMPDAGYGCLCDPVTQKRLGTLSIAGVHQEHGTVPVGDDAWFERLPVGSLVRVLPNHACITAAAYPGYDVVAGDQVREFWPRTNGW